MKKTFMLSLTVSALFISTNIQVVIAQSWNITGNNNATSSSKLGTTNLVPLKFFTNNAQRMIVDSLGRVGIGITKPVNIFTVKSGGGTPASSWLNGLNTPVFVGFGETVSSEFLLAGASNTAINRTVFQGRRSRGTLASPTAVANNDYITSLLASAYDGSTFQNPALVSFFVDGTPTAGNVPTRISFVTGSNAGNRTERLKVGSTGNFDFNNGQLFLRKSDGNLGIGTTTPTYPLDLRGSSSTTQIRLSYPSNGGPYFASIGFSDPNQGLLNICARMDMGFENLSGNSNSYVAFRTGQSGFAGNNDISTERMRITSSGNVGIGTATPGNRLVVTNNTIASATTVIQNLTPDVNFNDAIYVYAGNNGGRGFGAYHIAFFRPDGGFLGSIGQASETSVFFSTTSDKRLKTNIRETKFGLADVNKIQVRDYNFISDRNEQTGFIAQQLYEVFPEAVSVGGEDPKKRPWMVDYGRVTPLLVKAIQDLSVQNDAREATIIALQQQVNNLAEELKNLKLLIVKDNKEPSASLNSYLKQNVPNPFNGTTVINYYLPDKIRNAQIKIADMNGKILKTINISGTGKGTVNVDASILLSGAYNYSLFVNGKLVSTKQMERLK